MSEQRVCHCWKGRKEDIEERYGWMSPEYIEASATVDGTCMLLAGHEGPHVFTPDDQIGVAFPELEDNQQ